MKKKHHSTSCKKKKINKLTGAAGAWAEQSVEGHWWTFHSGWAPQALCCRSGVCSAVPPQAAHSSAHSDSGAALWFAQHTECPAIKRCIFFTCYNNYLQENLECQLQAWWQFPSAASKALHNCSEIILQPQRLWSDGNKELQHHSKTPNCRRSKGRNPRDWQLTYPGITRPSFNSLFYSLQASASYCIQRKQSHFKFYNPSPSQWNSKSQSSCPGLLHRMHSHLLLMLIFITRCYWGIPTFLSVKFKQLIKPNTSSSSSSSSLLSSCTSACCRMKGKATTHTEFYFHSAAKDVFLSGWYQKWKPSRKSVQTHTANSAASLNISVCSQPAPDRARLCISSSRVLWKALKVELTFNKQHLSSEDGNILNKTNFLQFLM